jgi:hypothetical protein
MILPVGPPEMMLVHVKWTGWESEHVHIAPRVAECSEKILSVKPDEEAKDKQRCPNTYHITESLPPQHTNEGVLHQKHLV